jgi:hypothetical protein
MYGDRMHECFVEDVMEEVRPLLLYKTEFQHKTVLVVGIRVSTDIFTVLSKG